MRRILVAGVGNVFLGDDGFGCEVARRLREQELPSCVDVGDFGIRGIDLGYLLMDGYDTAILVDTVQRGGAPGTVYLIEPEQDAPAGEGIDAVGRTVAPHSMDPVTVMHFAASLGGRLPRMLLVSCEPATLGGDEGHMGLSAAVTAALEPAVAMVRTLLAELAAGTEDALADGVDPGIGDLT